MKNIRSNRAGKEWGNIIKCNFQPAFKMLRRSENERLAGVHRLKKQIGHESLLRTALILLLGIDNLFGKVAFTLADYDRVVAIDAKIGDDVFLPQFIVEVHQRNNPRFDEHEKREPQGDPLFAGEFQRNELQI